MTWQTAPLHDKHAVQGLNIKEVKSGIELWRRCEQFRMVDGQVDNIVAVTRSNRAERNDEMMLVFVQVFRETLQTVAVLFFGGIRHIGRITVGRFIGLTGTYAHLVLETIDPIVGRCQEKQRSHHNDGRQTPCEYGPFT